MQIKIFILVLFLFFIREISCAQEVSATMTTSQTSSFPPPEYLKNGRFYTFQGEKDELAITLQLKKKSETKIQYELSVSFPNGQKLKEKGIAKITSSYDMGDEERMQHSTGEMVSCTLYFNEPKQDISICLGDLYNSEPPYEILDNQFFVEVTLEREGYPAIDTNISPELFRE